MDNRLWAVPADVDLIRHQPLNTGDSQAELQLNLYLFLPTE